MVTGSRDTTTVAAQALYLLNDPFVRPQSLALAERLLAATQRSDDEPDRPGLSARGRPRRPAEPRPAGRRLPRGLRRRRQRRHKPRDREAAVKTSP